MGKIAKRFMLGLFLIGWSQITAQAQQTPAPADRAPAAAPAAKPEVEQEGAAKAAINKQTCFCVISKNNLTGNKHQSGVCNDLTGAVNLQFSGLQPSHSQRESQCAQACTAKAAPLTGNQGVAQCACSQGAPNGTVINAYRAVGNNGQYDSAHQIGVLKNSPAVTQTKCPATWLANQTNVDGGVTADGKCKKLSGTLSITPVPPNGTPLGTYGFSWGNQVYAWGTQANGGAPITTTVSAATCSF
jgi:hypothetical protein